MEYVRLCETVADYGKLIPANANIDDYIKNPDKDYYVSIFKYNETHYQQFKKTKSVSGITDVKTNKLIWDFDSEDNIDVAKDDALTLVSRLISKGVNQNDILICFSGSKGFSVEIETTEEFSPHEFKNINLALAGDLKSNDRKIYNANRIFRIFLTKHNKTGLYKFPLTLKQLSELPISVIQELAKNPKNANPEEFSWKQVVLPKSISYLKVSQTKKIVQQNTQMINEPIDFSQKPFWLSKCKYALMLGHFDKGNRNNALMTLAATFKAQGFPKDVVYRMLKGVAQQQAERTGTERYPDSEIWNNVINSVYSPTWQGGTYSCQTQPWLMEICTSLGVTDCSKDNKNDIFIELGNVATHYEKYATEIEKNTIKTGINKIDQNVLLSTSMVVGLLGAPGSGKTSLTLNILKNTSLANNQSIFFSADMGLPLVFQKLVQMETGYSRKEVIDIYRFEKEKAKRINDKLFDVYKNVKFSFKSGLDTEAIKNSIVDHQQLTGEKVRLVAFDYLECIQGPYSDSIANTSVIANQIKDIANELEVCFLLLLQPQKHAGDPSSPLLSMRNVKGSSTIEQSTSVILSIYREGFDPRYPDEDKFITISTVKDRTNALQSFDFKWTGNRGIVTELSDEEYIQLENIRERKAKEKNNESDW